MELGVELGVELGSQMATWVGAGCGPPSSAPNVRCHLAFDITDRSMICWDGKSDIRDRADL